MIQFKVYDVGPEFWDKWEDPTINVWQLNSDLWNELLDTYDQYFLDLYDWDNPRITLSIEDIQTSSPESVFTKTFRVPATPNNNQFFRFAFEINGVDFDATVKKPAEILVDGQYFRAGHIRLNGVYYDNESGNIDYEVLFMGELRDLATTIGDRTLCQLNFDDYEHANNYANIVNSWQAFPQGAKDDGLFNGDILYPLVEFGNNYDDKGVVQETRIASVGSLNFTQNSNPVDANRFKPMVRAKAIWDRIFQTYGYSYASEFLNSDRFRKIYISAWGTEPNINIFSGSSVNIFSATNGTVPQTMTAPSKQLLRFEEEVLNPSNNYDTTISRFTAPVSGTYKFTARTECYLRTNTSNPITATIGIYKTPIGPNPPDIEGNSFSSSNGLGILTVEGSLNLTAGEQVAILIEFSGLDYTLNLNSAVFNQSSFECTEAPGNVIPNYMFDCEYKQLDFIKDIINTFKLVIAPDNDNPRKFLVEPWNDFIGKGTKYDWTQKLDGTKDVKVEPLFYTQTEDIDFSFTPETDYINEFHQNTTKFPYGRLQFLSDNDLLTGKREITTSFGPTPVLQIEGEDDDSNFIIPHIHTHSNTDYGLEHLPLKANTRILFYNGIQSFNGNVSFNHWHFTDGVIVHQYDTWPLVTPYEDWPLTENSLHLNFNKDVAYFGTNVPGIDGSLGISLFDEYWAPYISELYNRFGRKLTAHFILDNYDLQNLTFNDVIFLNGTWYRPEKVYDAQVGERTSVKCELVKLIGYRDPADELVLEVNQDFTEDVVIGSPINQLMSFNNWAPGDPLNDVYGPNGTFTKAGYDVTTAGGAAIAWNYPENGLYKMKYRWIVRYDTNMWFDPAYGTSMLDLRLSGFNPPSTDINLIGGGQLVSLFPDTEPGNLLVLIDYETPILDLRDGATLPINTTQVRFAEFVNKIGGPVGQTMFTYRLASVQVFKTS